MSRAWKVVGTYLCVIILVASCSLPDEGRAVIDWQIETPAAEATATGTPLPETTPTATTVAETVTPTTTPLPSPVGVAGDVTVWTEAIGGPYTVTLSLVDQPPAALIDNPIGSALAVNGHVTYTTPVTIYLPGVYGFLAELHDETGVVASQVITVDAR